MKRVREGFDVDPPVPVRQRRAPMEYDRLGFPIPPRFEPAAADDEAFAPRRTPPAFPAQADAPRRRAGSGKRSAVLAVAALVIVPALLGPALLPVARDAVVEWSLERADRCEARGDVSAALAHVDRALRWTGDDARIFVLRGQLRLENADAAGAVEDAARAALLAPTSPQPRRLRALAHTVLGNAEEALADAQAVVDMGVAGDPEALNLRAYTRALLRRDLPEALADIERALAVPGEPSPEHLDTRGYVLHLLGRHAEAIEDLNSAIDGLKESRRRLSLVGVRLDPDDLARRLRTIDQGLAVMHHHRAEACLEAGFAAQAGQDLEVARRKGYDPSRGVF